MRFTQRFLIGSPTYGNWPWPAKLPLKEKWYHHIAGGRSVAKETRAYHVIGDFLLCGVVAYSMVRAYMLTTTNAYQTHLCYLNNHPPAIVANEFDFQNPAKNRTVTREQLQKYREDAVECKKMMKPVESIIFKY